MLDYEETHGLLQVLAGIKADLERIGEHVKDGELRRAVEGMEQIERELRSLRLAIRQQAGTLVI